MSSRKEELREEMEKEMKDRERQFRTAKPGALAGVSEAVAVSEPDTSGSFTIPKTSASSNVWGASKKTSSQAPSTNINTTTPNERERSNVWANKKSVPYRSTSPKPSDDSSNNVWGAKKTQAASPATAVRAAIQIVSKGPSTSTREQEELAIKERERAARMTSTMTTHPAAGQGRSSNDRALVSEPDMSPVSRATAVRAPVRILSKGPSSTSTREQEELAIKERERAARMTSGTMTTHPAAGQGTSSISSNRAPTSEPDTMSISITRPGVVHVPGSNHESEASSGSASKRRTEQEDEQIKDRERQLRTNTTASGPRILTIRTPGAVAVSDGTSTTDPIQTSSSKGSTEQEDEQIKDRERQLRTNTTASGPRILTIRTPGDVAVSDVNQSQTSATKRLVDEDEIIKAREGQNRTAHVTDLAILAGDNNHYIDDQPAVVSEAYTANPVDRSAISSRGPSSTTLPEKSRTAGPRKTHGVGAIAATGEGEALDGMIRAKRGRHEANVGNSITTSTFDPLANSEPLVEHGEVPAESVAQAQVEVIPKGAFRVYANNIAIRQQPGTLSNTLGPAESVSEMSRGDFPPHDPEEPNDPTATSFVPDERDIDDTDNEGKPENVPFYKSRKFLALIGIVVLAAIAIGVGVALSSGGDDGLVVTPAPTAAPTEDPIYQERQFYLTFFLEDEGLDVESLDDPSSYQSAAFNWIVKDDDISRIEASSTDEEIQFALSRYVLAVFYYSLNGSRWISGSGWLDATLGHCSWQFISCNAAGLITSISTGSFLEYLADSIPFEAAMGQGGNNLEGILPSELKYFTSLVDLHLQNNLITGIVDGSLHEGMSDLKVLSLGGNQIADLSTVYTLTSLEILNLHKTREGGSIDTQLGGLSNLRHLILSNNGLSGSITTEFNQMGLLEILLLDGNNLVGDINEVLSGTNNLVTVVADNNNLIGGELGVGFLNLTSIGEFRFPGTGLIGNIPTEISRLENLQHFDARRTELTGRLPSELGLMWETLGVFHVSQTRLSGPIPPEFWELRRLQSIFLESTFLTGTVPDQVCDWSDLQVIRLNCAEIECPCAQCVCV